MHLIDKYNVAEVSFNLSAWLCFFLLIQIEFFYSLCYTNVVFLSKTLRISKTSNFQNFLHTPKSNSIIFSVLLLCIIFLKGSHNSYTFIILFSIFFLYCVNYVLEKISTVNSSNNTIYLILPTFCIFFYFIYSIKSFLSLFFFIEIYSVLYYFCFLTSYNLTNQTILKYKNGLLFLLWNNFLTTFFLALGCFFLLKASGTTDFAELSFILISYSPLYFFLFGLFWKLGLPLFHFFKVEVYKYLLKENVFLFSLITTLINTIILFFCFSQPIIFNTIYLHNFIVLTIIFAILLSIVNLSLSNILQFFALSGVFTMATILTIFLI